MTMVSGKLAVLLQTDAQTHPILKRRADSGNFRCDILLLPLTNYATHGCWFMH